MTLPTSHARLGGAVAHHTISGNVTAEPMARLRRPTAAASDSTVPTTARGVAPRASMTANSRRRSKVAISMVLATPKLAMAKMMTMKTQYIDSARPT